jgi:SAM-dependent methyltransferase
MSRIDPSDTYALGHSEAETQRLIRQAQIYAPLTRRFFVAAGITSGMKVLDVGSGAGDVALLLADLVGPSGSVIGVEMNATILEVASARVRTAGWNNVTFLQEDIRSITLGDDFDAVVGRWVLSDFTYPPMVFPSGPLHQQVIKWTTSPPGHGIPDLQMGLHLYQTYLDAGLPAPQLRLEAPIGGGMDWPGYAYIAETVRSLLPMLEQMGMVTPEEVDVETLADRLRAEVVHQRGVEMLPIVIGAWTHYKP